MLVCCCDKIESDNKEFGIFYFEENLEEFLVKRERNSSECKGCFVAEFI